MDSFPRLPERLRVHATSLPAIEVKKDTQGRLKWVRTNGDWEYDTDPTGRYAYNLVSTYSWLFQWRIGTDGVLRPLSPHKVLAHSHPSVLCFHPHGRFAYITCSHGAICQYHVRSGVLIPMTPAEVYGANNPGALWFDRKGTFACVITPGHEGKIRPTTERTSIALEKKAC